MNCFTSSLLTGGVRVQEVRGAEAAARAPLLGVRPLRAGDGPPLPLGRQLRGQGQPQDLRHLPHPHGLHAGAVMVQSLQHNTITSI